MIFFTRKVFALLFALLVFNGCASLQTRQPQDFWARLDGIRQGDIIDTRTGKAVGFQSFIEQASKARIVYVGEVHTRREDHEVQLKVLRGLHAAGPVVLAMEMFPREKQPVLDRFSRGELTEQQFLEEVDWENVWGYPFELYRDILFFARDRGIPILALNAPPEVVRKIGREGLSSLTREEKERIAQDLRLHNSPYRELMKDRFEQHVRGNIKSFDTFYEAQLTWEETMAETLAQALNRHAPNVTIVALIGKGHMSHGLGVPKWVASLVPHAHITVTPVPMNYPHSVVDPDLGNYVWITEAVVTRHRGRLGIMILPIEEQEGVRVMSVSPGSAAQRAGLQAGDVILRIDDKTVRTFEDMHGELQKQRRTHRLLLLRGNEEIAITVEME